MEELRFASADSISDIQIMTVRDVLDLASERKLDLQPEFQRRKVWPKAAKSYLIDTVIRGLPIPEIFAYQSPKGSLAIIDGQQRLSTIIDFATENLHVWVGAKVITYEDLDEEQRKAFASYRMVFRVIKSSEDFFIRDIFQRLNKHTTSLSPQELRHARMDAALIRLAENRSQDMFWRTSGVISRTAWNRMKEVEFVEQLMLSTQLGPVALRGREDLDRHMQKITEKGLPQIESAYLRTLDTMKKIFDSEAFGQWFNRGDFFVLFVAVMQVQQNRIFIGEGKRIRDALYEFKQRVRSKKLTNKGDAFEYLRAMAGGSKEENLQTRIEILLGLVKRVLNGGSKA